MITIQNTYVTKYYNAVKFKKDHTDILFRGLGPSLFLQETASGSIELPAEVGHRVFKYLSVLDIHLLKRINTRFQACVNDFTHLVFREKSCFDFSNVSDTQVITYFLQDRIDSIILKAFGRALVEAPFLGSFQNTDRIPSHERYAIARGLVAANSWGNRKDPEPFISFYVGRRDQRPFTASTVRTFVGRKWQVQSSSPAVRFIYVSGIYGHHLYPINQNKNEPYLPIHHPDRDVKRLGNLDAGFGLRSSSWSLNNLLLISEIFENLDDCFIPFTSKFPISETITSQEPIDPEEKPQAIIEPLEEAEQPLAENVDPQAFPPPQEPIDEVIVEEDLEPDQNQEPPALVEQENNNQAVEHAPIIPQPLVPDTQLPQSLESPVVLEGQNLNSSSQEPVIDGDVQPLPPQPEEPQIPVLPNIPQKQPVTAPSWYISIPLSIWQHVVSFWSWLTNRSR